MNKLKVSHDTQGNTLTVWFGNPSKEAACKEIGEDTIVMKDKEGRVIGFEKLNYALPHHKSYRSLPIEVIST